MSIKVYKPTTPARRQMTVSGFDGVDKHAKPEKSLLEVLKKNSGRNSYGRITVRHQGGGNRQKYRVIDFKRNKIDVPAKVVRLEYDPNRSAFIALCEYEDGERRYILAPVGLSTGDTVLSSAAADIKPGNALPLANIPVGTVIHNIELYPGKGAQLVRSAGVSAQLMAKEGGMAQIRLPSGEYRKVRLECMATIGQVGNIDHANIHIGKAGRKRHARRRTAPISSSSSAATRSKEGKRNEQKYQERPLRRSRAAEEGRQDEPERKQAGHQDLVPRLYDFPVLCRTYDCRP